MKYRILTNEELLPLEEDLKAFLIVNGVDGSIWEKMNENEPDKAVELIELFSDVVLQKIYEKIRFLEKRSKNSCMVFKLGTNTIELISLQLKPESTCDLSTPESIHVALTKHSSEITYFKTSKKYSAEREVEIHQLIESGCVLSNETFWILLERVLN